MVQQWWNIQDHGIQCPDRSNAKYRSPVSTGNKGLNIPYLYSRYWTRTSLQWRFMRGNIFKKSSMSFTFEKTPRISLGCTLVPVQYREYEYGLLYRIYKTVCLLVLSLAKPGSTPSSPISMFSGISLCSLLLKLPLWCLCVT